MVTRNEQSPPSRSEDRCPCGAVHQIPLDKIVIDDDAIDELVAYLERRRWSRPFVVMDANTEEVAGAVVVEKLSGSGMRHDGRCAFPNGAACSPTKRQFRASTRRSEAPIPTPSSRSARG